LFAAGGGGKLLTSVAGQAVTDQFGNKLSGGLLTTLVKSIQPGSSPAVAETWHAMSLASGWGAASGNEPTYTLIPGGPNGQSVAVTGALTLPSSGTYNSVTFATLPSAYAPTNYRRWPVLPLAGTTYSNTSYPGAARAYISTGGAIQLNGIPSSLDGKDVDISGTYAI
jgi:hypothetical protein